MNPGELLTDGIKELNIPFSEKELDAFLMFLSELKKWNRTYNLTSLRTDRDIIVKHFLDSLLYLTALPGGALRLADAGSGAGFPGIPIRIMRPEIETTLIESSRKKAAFLRNVIRKLQLSGITVLENRLERLGNEFGLRWDVIASRATFSIREFIGMAVPYLKKGGLLVMSKGPKANEEIQALHNSPGAATAIKSVMKLRLPFSTAVRNLIVISCD